MKNDSLYYLAAAIICVAWLLTPGKTHAARNRNLNLSIEGNAESCSELKVRSGGEIAQAAESFTLRKSETPVLEVAATDHGNIRVRGWDRPDYSVEVCKIAVASDRSGADQLLKGVSVSRSAGRFSSNGPAGDDGQWLALFIVHAPKDAALDLETKNGPIDVRGVSGTVKVRAANGPIAIHDCSGNLEAHTSNGPIAFSGGGGDVHLNAQNGPISLRLAGESWNGRQLEARTINGPLAVVLPNTFRSGIRVETSGHGPISCSAGPFRDARRDQRTMQMNGSAGTVRLSTENGPVAVRGEGKSPRFI
jgi:hypothetical protein